MEYTIVDNEDIFNIISNFLSFNEILELRLLSKKALKIIKNNKTNKSIKYYNDFLDNRNTKYDKYRCFVKIINKITINYSYWSPYGGDTYINEYEIYAWNMLFSNVVLSPIHYAIYYAYFLLNNTAISETLDMNAHSYMWRAVTYDNGMIKQLTNSTGYLSYNNNITKLLNINLIYNKSDNQWGVQNNLKDIIIYYNTNVFSSNKIKYKQIIPVVDTYVLKLILNNRKIIPSQSYNKIRYIEDILLYHNIY
jgi:hypothetical protein